MKFLSFRHRIIVVVVGLSVIPIIIFGFNSLRLADQSQKVVDEMKNKIVISISSEVEEYFRRINKILAFTVTLEKRKFLDIVQVNKVLISALSSHREIFAIGYIKDGKIISFFGEKIKSSLLNKRISKLLKQYEKEKWVQISDSYKLSEKYVFDLLYPLEGGNFIYSTFLLEELKEKLQANNIGKTGKFALIKDDSIFISDEVLKYRLQFLEINKIVQTISDEFLATQKMGYQLKGKKVEGIIWSFWVIFTQKIKEANLLTRQLKLGILAVLIGILSISGVISFSLAKSFSRPISNLLVAVKSGDLETKAVLDKKDKGELSLLIRTFNQMIDNLKEAQNKLVEKERLAAVGEMANVIGHDIRNPLAAIKNGVYFIRHILKSDNVKATTSLDIMDREVNSINKIVDNLLGYSRQKAPSFALVDVNVLIDEVISLIEVPDNIEIKKEFSESLPKYNLDRDEMRQALVNIVNNAVQACDKEKGIVEITTRENGDLVIQIKDNGKGIPKDEMKNMFKAFYSTKEGGTGLGLASAKNIVERHKGTVKLNSIHGEGTEVIIAIPRL